MSQEVAATTEMSTPDTSSLMNMKIFGVNIFVVIGILFVAGVMAFIIYKYFYRPDQKKQNANDENPELAQVHAYYHQQLARQAQQYNHQLESIKRSIESGQSVEQEEERSVEVESSDGDERPEPEEERNHNVPLVDDLEEKPEVEPLLHDRDVTEIPYLRRPVAEEDVPDIHVESEHVPSPEPAPKQTARRGRPPKNKAQQKSKKNKAEVVEESD